MQQAAEYRGCSQLILTSPLINPTTGTSLESIAHVATFSLVTFAWQSVKSLTSCRGKKVGDNSVGGGTEH